MILCANQLRPVKVRIFNLILTLPKFVKQVQRGRFLEEEFRNGLKTSKIIYVSGVINIFQLVIYRCE